MLGESSALLGHVARGVDHGNEFIGSLEEFGVVADSVRWVNLVKFAHSGGVCGHFERVAVLIRQSVRCEQVSRLLLSLDLLLNLFIARIELLHF